MRTAAVEALAFFNEITVKKFGFPVSKRLSVDTRKYVTMIWKNAATQQISNEIRWTGITPTLDSIAMVPGAASYAKGFPNPKGSNNPFGILPSA